MTFEEYLRSKKIDSEAFKNGDEARWTEFSKVFNQVHPKSFTAQKLFLINGLRRSFPLKQDAQQQQISSETPKKVKPIIKPAAKKMKPSRPMMKKPKMK